MSSIAKNYFYNVIYQIATIIIPIITIPIVSRSLGSEGIGINAYTYSIIQYFLLLATIGISLYGNREIAYVRDNKREISIAFWGILYLKLITSLFSYIFFLVFLCMVTEYKSIFLVQSLFIISAAFDISWLFMGIEDFKKTVIRNLIVKSFAVVCIIIFIRNPTDLSKYVLILSLSELVGNLSLWVYLPKIISKVKIPFSEIKRHLKPAISLFLPQVAIQIYVVLNKTMLGIISTPNEVGFFDNADKVVRIALTLVTSIGIVMLPRVSNTFAKGDIKKVREFIYISFNFASYLSIPLMFGIASLAPNFAPWFFGPEFHKTGVLMSIISPITVFIAWSSILGNQFLISTGRIKDFTISVIVGAIVNFFLNIFLIKEYNSIGVAISTVISELTVFLVQLYLVSKDVEIKRLFKCTWKYFFSGLIMFFIIQYVGLFIEGEGKTITIKITSGILIYFISLLLLKSEINNTIFRYIFKKFTNRLGI